MKKKKSFNITLAIFAGLVLGILFGLFMPGRYEFLLPVVDLAGSLYMNALRMMIYPLVFCSLIVGIQGIGSISATGCISSAQRCLPACWDCFCPRPWAWAAASPLR